MTTQHYQTQFFILLLEKQHQLHNLQFNTENIDKNLDTSARYYVVYVQFLCVFGYRIERLWRDVFTAVTSRFYNVLHQLEEEGQLDLSSNLHIFCCHYTFIPLIQQHLNIFKDGWDDHPLSTEGNRSPNQLWYLGQQFNSHESVQVSLLCMNWVFIFKFAFL